MGNIVDDFGHSYVSQFFRGALFLYNSRLLEVVGVEDNMVRCRWCKLDGTSTRWTGTTVPFDHFASLESFAWPKLGYRNFPSEQYGNTVFYTTSSRSTLRGIRDSLIAFKCIPVQTTLYGCDEPRQFLGATKYLPAIFSPQWITMARGLPQMLDGDIPGFAVNEDIAIGLSSSVNMQMPFDIYYRERVVGHVGDDGTMVINNKIIKRATTFKLLKGVNTYVS